jgi:hypothetical protein
MQKEATMPTFSQSIEINATPDKVWAVLGDLASVHQWIPGISAVRHTQNEQILDYSPSARSYRYRIDDAPLPVTDNIGSFAVRPGDGHTRVVWESSFQPLDPAMTEQLAQMWQPYLPTVLGNLKNLIEK